ncbi:Hypp4824 [Branchiostoma lanceolatum]|uniref:Hypp4824 protein n=1 Tax=Branchiostoma lanceolatum TaxID=7740 RepID=A0A8K0AB56_BRALA|nr:Hypp4824 [Branchiostoma lanceolatum]
MAIGKYQLVLPGSDLQRCDMSTLQVMVRFNSNHSFMVNVHTSWTIARFKQELGRRQGVPPGQIHILFAGRDLPDSLRIADCQLGQQTVVHAISGLPQLSVDARGPSTSPRSLSDVQLNVRPDGAAAVADSLPSYFVYCKQPCKAVKPGKLRVRCGRCRQTTLTLSRKRRLALAGHVARHEEMAAKVLLWEPDAKRKRGRPNLTLKKVLEEEVGLKDYNLLAAMLDRNAWLDIVNGTSYEDDLN